MLQFSQKATPAAKIAKSVADDIVARMADKMRVLALNNIPADADNLGEDFTQGEIDTHWRDARDLARTMSVRQVGKAA